MKAEASFSKTALIALLVFSAILTAGRANEFSLQDPPPLGKLMFGKIEKLGVFDEIMGVPGRSECFVLQGSKLVRWNLADGFAVEVIADNTRFQGTRIRAIWQAEDETYSLWDNHTQPGAGSFVYAVKGGKFFDVLPAGVLKPPDYSRKTNLLAISPNGHALLLVVSRTWFRSRILPLYFHLDLKKGETHALPDNSDLPCFSQDCQTAIFRTFGGESSVELTLDTGAVRRAGELSVSEVHVPAPRPDDDDTSRVYRLRHLVVPRGPQPLALQANRPDEEIVGLTVGSTCYRFDSLLTTNERDSIRRTVKDLAGTRPEFAEMMMGLMIQRRYETACSDRWLALAKQQDDLRKTSLWVFKRQPKPEIVIADHYSRDYSLLGDFLCTLGPQEPPRDSFELHHEDRVLVYSLVTHTCWNPLTSVGLLPPRAQPKRIPPGVGMGFHGGQLDLDTTFVSLVACKGNTRDSPFVLLNCQQHQCFEKDYFEEIPSRRLRRMFLVTAEGQRFLLPDLDGTDYEASEDDFMIFPSCAVLRIRERSATLYTDPNPKPLKLKAATGRN
ncbi:MAG: hypothetical protein NTY01_09920 [Verrucomicrobia bacterium]|nr:hypothetical protein [Verrucomicrobiota bacterium]